MFLSAFIQAYQLLTSAFQKRNQVQQILPLEPVLKLHVCANPLSWCEIIQVAESCECGSSSAL